jgi:Ulp1 family protease
MLKILEKDRTGVQPTRFAGVINLGGLHYAAVYFDVRARSAEYFDSFGHGPDAKVRAFLDEAIAHLETKHGSQFVLRTPKIAHQTGGRECGMYALWFVMQRLGGKTYAWTQKRAVPDAQMAALRPAYFRT